MPNTAKRSALAVSEPTPRSAAVGKPAPQPAQRDAAEPSRPAGAGREAVAEADDLLTCLVFLTHFYERPYSAEVLKAGLPLVETQLTPSQFVRAAARAGLVARVAKRPLKAVADVLLPVVVILQDDQVAVLVQRKANGRAVVMLPEAGGGVQEMRQTQLEQLHGGYVIYIRPAFEREAHHGDEALSRRSNWFWGALLNNWWIYGQVILAAVIINVFALASPLFIMTVYDRVVPNYALDTLWVLAIGVIIVFVFDFAIKLLRGYYIDVAGKRADVVMASRLFDHVLDIQMAARPTSTGAFANTLRESETVRDAFTSATLTTIVDLPFLFLFIAVIWIIGGDIALVPLVTVPLVLIVGVLTQFPLNAVVRNAFRESQAKHGVLVETVGGLETVKSVGAENRMRHKWETYVGLAAQSSQRARMLSLTVLNLATTAQQISLVGVVVYGVILIGEGALSVGALIACVILNGRAVGALAQVAQLLVRVNHARASLRADPIS